MIGGAFGSSLHCVAPFPGPLSACRCVSVWIAVRIAHRGASVWSRRECHRRPLQTRRLLRVLSGASSQAKRTIRAPNTLSAPRSPQAMLERVRAAPRTARRPDRRRAGPCGGGRPGPSRDAGMRPDPSPRFSAAPGRACMSAEAGVTLPWCTGARCAGHPPSSRRPTPRSSSPCTPAVSTRMLPTSRTFTRGSILGSRPCRPGARRGRARAAARRGRAHRDKSAARPRPVVAGDRLTIPRAQRAARCPPRRVLVRSGGNRRCTR
jgi:hypothetical protein